MIYQIIYLMTLKTLKMDFKEIIESEFYYLIEAIEHGSSDNEIIENYKKELFEKTGYIWKN